MVDIVLLKISKKNLNLIFFLHSSSFYKVRLHYSAPFRVFDFIYTPPLYFFLYLPTWKCKILYRTNNHRNLNYNLFFTELRLDRWILFDIFIIIVFRKERSVGTYHTIKQNKSVSPFSSC